MRNCLFILMSFWFAGIALANPSYPKMTALHEEILPILQCSDPGSSVISQAAGFGIAAAAILFLARKRSSSNQKDPLVPH